MIELDKGHRFALRQLDVQDEPEHATLIFVKRSGPRYPGNKDAYPGTTSQEVLRALIARAKYVNAQIPAWQTRISIWLYRIALWLYENRAAKIHGRKISLRLLPSIEYFSTCQQCGHVGCYGCG